MIKHSPRQLEADQKLQALIQEYPDIFGPVQCKIHGRDVEACDCEADGPMAEPMPAFLSEYVIVSNWVLQEDGEAFLCDFTNPGSLISHIMGMLYTQLKIMEKDL